MLIWFLIVLGLVWLTFATVNDFRIREIPNWLSFSLIIFALGGRFFFDLFNGVGFGLFYQGLLGLLIFFILANLFYYAKLFAAGDAKLMMALGAVLPFYGSFVSNIYSYIYFIVIFLFVGSIYGLIFSLFLVGSNWKAFRKEFLKRTKKDRKLLTLVFVMGVIILLLGLKVFEFMILGILVLLLPFLYFYAKSIDECCMIKKIKPSKLTIGDWLYENVKVKGRVIKADWEGVDEKDIKLLKKRGKLVKVRYGIAFGVTFLLSFIVYVVFHFKGFF